jgi:TRAP-type mannitol/chloroaromatic compound transport system permease small subunit
MGKISALLLVIIMFLITIDVLSRYLLGRPVKGAYEITEMLFLSVVFLGLSYTQIYKGHVKVEFLVSRFSQQIQLYLDITMLIISFILYILLVWQGIEGFWESFQSGEYRWGLIKLPLWPVKFIIPFGALFLCFSFIDEILKNLSKLKSLKQ